MRYKLHIKEPTFADLASLKHKQRIPPIRTGLMRFLNDKLGLPECLNLQPMLPKTTEKCRDELDTNSENL